MFHIKVLAPYPREDVTWLENISGGGGPRNSWKSLGKMRWCTKSSQMLLWFKVSVGCFYFAMISFATYFFGGRPSVVVAKKEGKYINLLYVLILQQLQFGCILDVLHQEHPALSLLGSNSKKIFEKMLPTQRQQFETTATFSASQFETPKPRNNKNLLQTCGPRKVKNWKRPCKVPRYWLVHTYLYIYIYI